MLKFVCSVFITSSKIFEESCRNPLMMFGHQFNPWFNAVLNYQKKIDILARR